MIAGVEIHPLKTILDDRGMVRHMMRCTDPHFHQFGEIYFSVIFPGAVKAWHLHKKMELNYACISGNIKLALIKGTDVQEIFMGEDNYVLVKIPSGIWNGFMAIGNEKAIVANCASIPHDPDEIVRKDPEANQLDYHWGIRNG